MRLLVRLLRQSFVFGKGRPVALVLLLWTSTVSVLSELPIDRQWSELAGPITGTMTAARQFLFDGYQKSYPRKPLSQPVTIVALDEQSLAEIGQWPWPRNRLAQLLQAIAAYQPAAVGLDMYMPEPDQTSPENVANNLPQGTPAELAQILRQLPSHETELAMALNSMPSVLGAAGFDFETATSSAGMRSIALAVEGGDALPHVRQFDAVLASLPKLQAAAWGQAILSVDLDFGVVRRIPLVVALGDTLVPGLAMEMLRVATGDPAVRVQVARHGVDAVAVADLTVPTQPAGDIWLHFARSEDTAARYVSASSVLDGSVDSEQLAGKLVLLGLTGSGLHDMRTTALGELVPGIEIQAQVLESLFDGRFVLRPWWMKWLEVGSLLSIGLLLIWFIPRADSPVARFLRAVPRASVWITLGLNLVLCTAGYLLFRYQGLLFDAASFVIVLSGIVGCLVASALIEMDRQAKALAAVLQQRRDSAHLAAGELAHALGYPIHGDLVQAREEACRQTRVLAEAAAKHPQFHGQLDAATVDLISRAVPYRNINGVDLSGIRQALGDSQPSGSLDQTRFLDCLLEIAHYYREHWDGSGQPEGLAQDAIPLNARIAAVIEAWEESDRDAQTLQRLSGTQLDSRLVELLCPLSRDNFLN